jgi:hypothetical protein
MISFSPGGSGASSSGTQGSSFPAPGADGAIPVSRGGAWEVGVNKDPKANSVEAATNLSANAFTGNFLNIETLDQLQGIIIQPDSITAADLTAYSGTGGGVVLANDGIYIIQGNNFIHLTREQLIGLTNVTTTSGTEDTVVATYTWGPINDSLFQVVYLYTSPYSENGTYLAADPASVYAPAASINSDIIIDLGIVISVVDEQQQLVEVIRSGYVVNAGWSTLWDAHQNALYLSETPGQMRTFGNYSLDNLPSYGKVRQVGVLVAPDTLLLTPTSNIDRSFLGRFVEENQMLASSDAYYKGEIVYLDENGNWAKASNSNTFDGCQLGYVLITTAPNDPSARTCVARWGLLPFPSPSVAGQDWFGGDRGSPIYLSATPGLMSKV